MLTSTFIHTCRQLYTIFKDTKYYPRKLIDLISILVKVAGYKNQCTKFISFPIHQYKMYQKKKSGKKILQNRLVKKIIKYLEINLTGGVNDLYSERYVMLI